MNASLTRKKARENLAGNWALSIAVAFVASILGGLMISSSFFPEITTSSDSPYALPLFNGAVSLGLESDSALNLVHLILGGVIQLGYARFLLAQHDGLKTDMKDLFSQFDRFGQGFAQYFLRRLYAALWGLLFIVPGIIKSLSYAMTPYIMADNPNMAAKEAIEASKQMMEGHKADLFILHLSFIGWDLLAVLALGLGFIVLNPYKNAAEAAFYRELAPLRTHEYL